MNSKKFILILTILMLLIIGAASISVYAAVSINPTLPPYSFTDQISFTSQFDFDIGNENFDITVHPVSDQINYLFALNLNNPTLQFKLTTTGDIKLDYEYIQPLAQVDRNIHYSLWLLNKSKMILNANNIFIKVNVSWGNGVEVLNSSILEMNAKNIEISLLKETYADRYVEAACLRAFYTGSTITLNANEVRLSTKQERGYGIFLHSGAEVIINAPKTYITTSGLGAYGVRGAFGENTLVQFNGDVIINTSGNESSSSSSYTIYGSHGLFASGGVSIEAKNVTITTLGNYASGLFVSKERGQANYNAYITVENSLINTKGKNAYGLAIENQWTNRITEEAAGGVITALNAKITTSGQYAHGIYINTLTNTPSLLEAQLEKKVTIANVADIATVGDNAAGIYVKRGGIVEIGGANTLSSKIVTAGDFSYGIYVDGKDINGGYSEVKIRSEYFNILTKGDSAHAVNAVDGGKFSIARNSTLVANGNNADVFCFSSTLIADFESIQLVNINAKSLTSNLISLIGDSTIVTMSFSENSVLFGNLLMTDDQSYLEMNLLDETTWQGLSHEQTGSDTFMSVVLKDTAIWSMTGTSFLNMLNITEDAKTVFMHQSSDTYYNLNLSGNLLGYGTIVMNVDLSKIAPKSDFIAADKADADMLLKIINNGNGGIEKQYLIHINDASTNANFTLDGGQILIWKYIYKLGSEDGDNNRQNWFLYLDEETPEIEDDFDFALYGLFEFAKAIDASISDDIIRPRDDWWFITIGKDQIYEISLLGKKLEQQIGGAIVGRSKRLTQSLTAGGFIGSNVGYQQIGKYGSVGHMLDILLGAYINYTSKNLSLSSYIRGDYYRHNLRLYNEFGDKINSTTDSYGFSASIDAMYTIRIGDLVYLAPKGKATFTYLAPNPYDFNGYKVDAFDEKGFVFWLGGRLGKSFINEYKKEWSMYLEAGWIYDTNPKTILIEVNGDPTPTTIGKYRTEIGIGMETAPLGKATFALEVKYAWGKGITEPIKLKISGSWDF